MEDSEKADGAESSAQTRPKRSRTGCLTCRTRRRKCDEGKPTCQNCTAKGFECRYAAAFQILGKNNFTPEVASKVEYTTLKFISGKREEGTDEANEVKDRHETPAERSPIVTFISPVEAKVTEAPQSQEAMPPASSPSTDSYEFALHGLLALGSGTGGVVNAEVNFSPRTGSGDNASMNTVQGEINMDQIVPTIEDFNAEKNVENQIVEDWRSINVPSSVGFEEVPHERVLELLKHYRYDVATWLDICDMGQTFGCEVLHLSTESTSIRYGLLALADKSLNKSEARTPNIALLADIFRQQDHTLDAMHTALLDVMTIAGNVCVDVSKFWLEEEDAILRNSVINTLFLEIGNNSFASSMYWLLVRLQLSVALMSSFTHRIPLQIPITMVATRTFFSGANADDVSQYTHDAVALCVDAAMYCQGDEDKWLQQRYAQTRADIWGTLVRGFEKWFTSRPQDFQAIIELYPRDGRRSEDEFPTLVFSSGAAILANQLCHTGMLLLLQNKPRFAGQANSNSPFMSTLWHTHRVCGIGINNDRRECWDPCLLASLLVAARMATHQSQHIIILSTLEGIQKLTGWDISHHLNNLRTEWRLAEAW
ncbi:hypothetical protein K505DRAFT_355826 [Melanomma pulvis-pyrius CBS 109.77]|uniref:Zn(2)-C6 fungal-type domain-containing protein n=1 Tax=Melanomma pulvis-pyrius CBS 109.77 TaxID=1314802 RepID=A0A6A6XV33_9PLEO|nr:hypothetical protein K505DRAFT_355826 [Melanomma pulvis-pyrius CBS 109.77]